MLKSKINFIIFVSTAFIGIHQIASALDLKIDLPLSYGKMSAPNYKKNLPSSVGGLPSTVTESDVLSEIEASSDSPVALSNQTLFTDKSHFPELPCLKSNIAFWEKIYAKFDTDDAVLHDRSELGRVYGVVRHLPKGNHMRVAILKRAEKKYAAVLTSLARKLNKPRLWNAQEKRMASLFSKSELKASTLLAARDDIRAQFGLKSQFNAGVIRSMNYLPIVYPIVKKSGLPMDLIFLPHVESSYNSRAGSKVGAMGLWQLMPSTMRLLSGSQNVNKRTDPTVSTQAALKLLKMDFDKIQNWPLALTAYNHGNNGILKAMKETRSSNLCQVIERYSSPSFKFASTNFYAQFVAARKVAIEKYKKLDKKQTAPLLKHVLLSATGGKFE